MSTPTAPVSAFLPPGIRNDLVNTQGWAGAARHLRIDTLTMQAHKQYPDLVRHPGDTSRESEWALIRARTL